MPKSHKAGHDTYSKVQGVACYRWSPRQALQHPFITRALFTGPFQPTPDSPVPIRSRSDYAASSTADGHAALIYSLSQGQSAAALANSSPEARAQAHLAALAAVAHLGPHASLPGPGPGAYQTANLQVPLPRMSSAQQQPQSQQLPRTESEFLPAQGTPFGERTSASRPQVAGSDSTISSMGANFTPSMSMQQSLYGSFPLHQQPQQAQMMRFGSIAESPVAVPVPIQRQAAAHLPVGSLEALRGGWHAPRGRNAFGDMYASSLTVPSQRLSGASSLAGSYVGSLGAPRLPPSLSKTSRNSFQNSPAGSAMLSPSSAAPAATPNRVCGFGPVAYSDQLSVSQQQSLHQRPYPSPHHRKHRQQQTLQQQQAEQDTFGRLFDDLAGIKTEDAGTQGVNRQPSLDAADPCDWDPYYRQDNSYCTVRLHAICILCWPFCRILLHALTSDSQRTTQADLQTLCAPCQGCAPWQGQSADSPCFHGPCNCLQCRCL